MSQGFRRPSPATIVALVALLAALTGSAYAAGRIDGRTLKVKSLPRQPPEARLGAGEPPQARGAADRDRDRRADHRLADRRAQPRPGAERRLRRRRRQRTAIEAQTALDAVNAVNSEKVNGHSAGCRAGTVPFAGACWQTSASQSPVSAPVAAAACPAQGGALPEALQLAAFAQQPDIQLKGDEWSGDLTNFSGSNAYGVLTVFPTSAIDMVLPTAARNYRCVVPIVT